MVINLDVCVWSVVCIAGSGCNDSFVRFQKRSATQVLHITPQPSISTLDHCKSSCLRNADCGGFNWIRDEALKTGDGKPKCIQYDRIVGDTTTDSGLDLYLRETCVPGMYRVRQIKVIPCRFLLTSKPQVGIF